MPVVKIAKKHSLGAEEAKRRVQKMEGELQEQYGVDVQWSGNRGTFQGKAFTGGIDVRDDRVAVALRLGLTAGPFAGRIRERLATEMTRILR